jgi:hypothetical protein
MRRLMSLVLFFLFGLMGSTLAVAQEPNAHQAGTKKESKAQPKAQSKSTKASTTAESSKNASKPQEPPLAPQEMSIAERVHVGHLPCELGASVRMTADANAPGYFNLQGKGYKYRMRPVTTTTGAIRLEDEKAGAVWLQLASDSRQPLACPSHWHTGARAFDHGLHAGSSYRWFGRWHASADHRFCV